MQEKTALVLSAGGMFGAYQAGAWKALERHLKPDIVVGASAGALNGWLIAGGCSGDELARQWLEPATGSILKWRSPQLLSLKAQWLHASYTPKVPFGLVVARLPWLSATLIRSDAIRPEHLVATCSIPGFLPSVRIAGERFTDGGIREALPIHAAIEMGATRIVAVNAMPRWGNRPIKFPTGIDVTLISPSEPLATLRNLLIWDEYHIRRSIHLGERDARQRFPLQ